jgi:DNA-binding NtrC family response regulator
MSRILVHEPPSIPDECTPALAGLGYDVILCEDREALFDSMAERKPDLLVYVLHDVLVDVAVLSLLRRVAPHLPIILLGESAALEVRRCVQELRPTYYGMFPLEPAELRDAVSGALEHHGRAMAS